MKTTRRELLKAGLYGIGIGASGLLDTLTELLQD